MKEESTRTVIELLDDWVILVDTYSYNLAKKKTSKKGEEVFDLKSYHGSLCKALKAFGAELSKESLGQWSTSLTDAVRRIEESNNRVAKLIEDSFKGFEL